MSETPSQRWAGPARGFALLAGAVALIMALLPHPPVLPGNPSDKLVHAATFGMLTLLIAQGWPRAGFWTILICLSGFGIAIEVLQGLPSIHRAVDFGDWLVDTAAVAAALFLLAPMGRWARQGQ